MARIELTPELLHSPIEKVNVCNFYNPLEDLSCALDNALDYVCESYYEEHGTELDTYGIALDGRTFYKEAMADWIDFLEQYFDELFGEDGPIKLWGPGELGFDNGGWGYMRDSYTVTWQVDGQKLYDLAKSYGITSVHDGHGISGFVRTCDDAAWAKSSVIAELMEAMSDTIFYDILEYYNEVAHEHVEVQIQDIAA